MNRYTFLAVFGSLVVFALLSATGLAGPLLVNDYVGIGYEREPVSFDVALDPPRPLARIGLNEAPSQTEILEGTPDAVSKARIWTLITSGEPQQFRFTVADGPGPQAPSPFTRAEAEPVEGIAMAEVANGAVRVRVPVGSVDFDPPISALRVPGPVAAIGYGDGPWIGDGYLDTMVRIRSVRSEVREGPVFWEVVVTYQGEEDHQTYRAAVRLTPGKPYAALTEDFSFGGASRFVFSYGDWAADRFLTNRDGGMGDPAPVTEPNPASDFIQEEGQVCLSRLVIWSQFGYFRGKQETIGLIAADRTLSVGGFYLRPDLWTRPKINRVDLYVRPQVPGDRMSRGVVGLEGSRPEIAMEAWIIEGHRRWALYALPPFEDPADEEEVRPVAWLQRAHIREGVWPLDRMNRLTLVWNRDGSPAAPEHQVPEFRMGGGIAVVLSGTRGRSGLAYFNGSNPHMRGEMGSAGEVRWARENPEAGPDDPEVRRRMVERALMAYMMMDESAYPGRRAMLPWTDPEALNPFYQGMENMNFNADRYRLVSLIGEGLVAMGHPDGETILLHGQEQMDMALDRYVYPQSGTWEESHTYANHTLHNLLPLADVLVRTGQRNFYEDERFAAMFDWWTWMSSPRDPQFDHKRVMAPVGDHGLSIDNPLRNFRAALPRFAAAESENSRRVAARMAWLFGEKNEEPPEGVEPEAPDLSSRFVQGLGAIFRHPTLNHEGDPGGENFVILRSGQSWGHHHEDKGSVWFWGRNVHFFGNAAWGAPPGGTYFNPYKQGPAGRTQIQITGVTNWPLPCKYAAGWIEEDEYAEAFSYAWARNPMPFNPDLDLTRSTPPGLLNGYDRQVLLVGDVLVVRDTVESLREAIWRMHSYQADGTEVREGGATITSPVGAAGDLAFAYPDGVRMTVHDRPEGSDQIFGRAIGPYQDHRGRDRHQDHDTRSLKLRTEIPPHGGVTWAFTVRAADNAAAHVERLDEHGRVVRIRPATGPEVVVLMDRDPFAYEGHGIRFEGRVGLVVLDPDGPRTFAIRAERLEMGGGD